VDLAPGQRQSPDAISSQHAAQSDGGESVSTIPTALIPTELMTMVEKHTISEKDIRNGY
jgi:hypothetical protein